MSTATDLTQQAGVPYVCPECNKSFRQKKKPGLSFLAFRVLECPGCGKRLHYPLKGVSIIVYVAVAAAVAIGFIITIVNKSDSVVFPGIGWFIIVYALLVNWRLHSRIGNAWRRNQELGYPNVAHNPVDEAEAAPTAEPTDRVRWYYFPIALFLPLVAIPWGVLKLMNGQRRSGGLLLGLSLGFLVVILGLHVIIFLIHNR